VYLGGIAAIGLGRVVPVEAAEAWLTPLGAALVATAHVWNWRLCRLAS
jgi:hypothetical protein